jgi:hypothetical protein
VVRADNKPHARINVIRHVLARLDYKGKDKKLAKPDRRIVFPYDKAHIADGSIAP